jgi:hypothetical protein
MTEGAALLLPDDRGALELPESGAAAAQPAGL